MTDRTKRLRRGPLFTCCVLVGQLRVGKPREPYVQIELREDAKKGDTLILTRARHEQHQRLDHYRPRDGAREVLGLRPDARGGESMTARTNSLIEMPSPSGKVRVTQVSPAVDPSEAMGTAPAGDSSDSQQSHSGHPCAYTGDPCDMCGCVDECMGISVGYYDRRAIAEGRLERID